MRDVSASRWRRIVTSRGLWGFAGFAAVAAALVWGIDALGGAEGLRARFGWQAPVILIAAQAVAGLWPIPAGEFLAFTNSAVHGFWLGSAFNWIGWMLTALLQYQLARRTAREFNFESGLKLLPARVRRFPAEHPAFLILGRLVPGPGPQLVNCMAGALEVPLWRHTWCAAISILPGAMIIAAVANGLMAL